MLTASPPEEGPTRSFLQRPSPWPWSTSCVLQQTLELPKPTTCPQLTSERHPLSSESLLGIAFWFWRPHFPSPPSCIPKALQTQICLLQIPFLTETFQVQHSTAQHTPPHRSAFLAKPRPGAVWAAKDDPSRGGNLHSFNNNKKKSNP